MTDLKMGADLSDLIDPYNSLIYIISQEIKKINTADLVRVVAINDNNTIDVQPIVKNVNAENNPIDTSVIYGVRYLQWQYGLNGLKATPMVGDIGLIISCEKDISNAENGIVGSFRRYSLADGIYIGGIMGLNQAPTQFIEFSENSIKIKGTGEINIEATTKVSVNAPTVDIETQNANINATVGVSLGKNAVKQIARVGDNVVSGTTVIGQIQANDSIVKSL